MRCERCGRERASWSERPHQVVCWHCYDGSFSAEEVDHARRCERQRQLAAVIGNAADRIGGRRGNDSTAERS
jgi:hypothetical protein